MKYQDKVTVGYYRVSTKQQGNSGLGLEAQRISVVNFLGCSPDFEFTEVESGKNDQRLELKKALKMVKDNNGILIIAKLDRLSRNLTFLSQIQDSEIEFVCCDNPNANKLTISLLAVFAQDERERISIRTKESLAVLKNRGVKLGTPANLTDKARERSAKTRREQFLSKNKVAIGVCKMLRENGKTLNQIADELETLGIKTSLDCKFSAEQVRRLLVSGV